ncbi:MAG: 30S ribosomal protein S6 [Chlorobi bacterium]|nr:30S ribosomal protein S6 [Chlorobiota bacterium]
MFFRIFVLHSAGAALRCRLVERYVLLSTGIADMSNRRLYETVYIVNATLEDAEIEEAINRINEYIVHHGGTIQEVNRWGRRRLAYPIKKRYNGYYVHCTFEASPSSIPIIERYLVLDDSVLRHLTVQLPQRLIEYRAQRAVNSTQQAPAPVAEPTAVPTEQENAEQN